MRTMKHTRRVERRGNITPKLIATYQHLMELLAMDRDDANVWNQIAVLRHEIYKAAGRRPWDNHENAAADAFDRELRAAAKIPRKLVARLRAIEKKREEKAIREAEHYILYGPHARGWDEEKKFAEFKEEHGYRPGEGPRGAPPWPAWKTKPAD